MAVFEGEMLGQAYPARATLGTGHIEVFIGIVVVTAALGQLVAFLLAVFKGSLG